MLWALVMENHQRTTREQCLWGGRKRGRHNWVNDDKEPERVGREKWKQPKMGAEETAQKRSKEWEKLRGVTAACGKGKRGNLRKIFWEIFVPFVVLEKHKCSVWHALRLLLVTELVSLQSCSRTELHGSWLYKHYAPSGEMLWKPPSPSSGQHDLLPLDEMIKPI